MRDYARPKATISQDYRDTTRSAESNHAITRQFPTVVRTANIVLTLEDRRRKRHNDDLLEAPHVAVRIRTKRWNVAADIPAKADARENEKSLSAVIREIIAHGPLRLRSVRKS